MPAYGWGVPPGAYPVYHRHPTHSYHPHHHHPVPHHDGAMERSASPPAGEGRRAPGSGSPGRVCEALLGCRLSVGTPTPPPLVLTCVTACISRVLPQPLLTPGCPLPPSTLPSPPPRCSLPQRRLPAAAHRLHQCAAAARPGRPWQPHQPSHVWRQPSPLRRIPPALRRLAALRLQPARWVLSAPWRSWCAVKPNCLCSPLPRGTAARPLLRAQHRSPLLPCCTSLPRQPTPELLPSHPPPSSHCRHARQPSPRDGLPSAAAHAAPRAQRRVHATRRRLQHAAAGPPAGLRAPHGRHVAGAAAGAAAPAAGAAASGAAAGAAVRQRQRAQRRAGRGAGVGAHRALAPRGRRLRPIRRKPGCFCASLATQLLLCLRSTAATCRLPPHRCGTGL